MLIFALPFKQLQTSTRGAFVIPRELNSQTARMAFTHAVPSQRNLDAGQFGTYTEQIGRREGHR
jgi:hypothetical protein